MSFLYILAAQKRSISYNKVHSFVCQSAYHIRESRQTVQNIKIYNNSFIRNNIYTLHRIQ